MDAQELKAKYEEMKSRARRFENWIGLDELVNSLIEKVAVQPVVSNQSETLPNRFSFDSEGTPFPHEDHYHFIK